MTRPDGRDNVLTLGDALLDAASERFAAFLVEGAAGIGKTTVWREVVERAEQRGFRVLACRPAEPEAKYSFSALADLLEPVPALALSSLPPPQRRALEVAVLRAEPPAEPVRDHALAAAVRSLLTGLAAERPILVAIDDVQWLDSASATILQFVLRRLTRERVALLVARRRDESTALRIETLVPPERLTRATLEPLSLGALHHVLDRQLGYGPPRALLVRIQRASRGNPFFALEIARLLAEGGAPAAGEPLPVPPDLTALVRGRVARLPASTREVLLLAGTLAEPRSETVRAALGRAIDSDLEAAEREGIAARSGDRIAFTHPLFAAAILALEPSSGRRQSHRRLAAVADNLEERARHLALAAEGQDQAAAAIVQAAARDVLQRGSPREASELLELALRLGVRGTEEEAGLILQQAECLQTVGESSRARGLLEGVDWTRQAPRLHGRAVEVLCDAISDLEPPVRAAEIFERMLRGQLPGAARASVHVGLSYVTSFVDPSRGLREADEALALLRSLGPSADAAAHAAALYVRLRCRVQLGLGLDRKVVEQILRLEEELPPERRRLALPSASLGYWFKNVDDLAASRRWLQRTIAALGDEQAPHALEHLAITECWAGNLEVAREHASTSLELMAGNPLAARSAGALALVEAHLGDADAVRSLARQHRRPHSVTGVWFDAALGLVELSLANYEAADGALRAAVETIQGIGWREPSIRRVHADAAEAALAVGDSGRAEEIGRFLIEHGVRTGRRSSRATGERVQALLASERGEVDEALAASARALEAHEGLDMPFELARTLLVRGRVERRARRRAAAKESFEGAVELFEGMGARLWAERARGEHERVGLRRAAGNELTVNERRVAELAARGLTNREVAAALFLSPKTVEANLARVYRKLGIRSRAELGGRMAELVQT